MLQSFVACGGHGVWLATASSSHAFVGALSAYGMGLEAAGCGAKVGCWHAAMACGETAGHHVLMAGAKCSCGYWKCFEEV